MSDVTFQIVRDAPPVSVGSARLPLGRHLVNSGVLSPHHLVRALEMQLELNAPLGKILINEGWVRAEEVQAALARQFDLYLADLDRDPPEPGLAPHVPAEFWLSHRAVPWMQLGNVLVVAMARPDKFSALQDDWPGRAPEILPVLGDESAILSTLAKLHEEALANAASERVDMRYSCRNWGKNPVGSRPWLLLPTAALLACIIAWPDKAFAVLSLMAVLALGLISSLKILGAGAALSDRSAIGPPVTAARRHNRVRMPKVSVLVPLYREKEIAGRLVSRLTRLTYPKVLLDVVLVLEEGDAVTREALAQTELPPWMRVVRVPAHGQLTTKPRAMNYALDFCDGEIIGVWDAEDAPDPDQIERAVTHFAQADEDVVCLQGVLDYYNPKTNWIARCFTIEYASWWRIILPGLARMGWVIPLGGTTLFFRREVLTLLGGWDAHNVTEDADLGVRLAREGFRTELMRSVTYEEANHRPWPWIKQRSRWLKGFMVTYLVHMRRPVGLWRDLGTWRFFGLQAFFLGTVGQFLLAPVLWTFWLIFFGAPHAITQIMPVSLMWFVSSFFILLEVANITIGMSAVSGPRHRHLMIWVPTLMFYFPLGAVAAYKALLELLVAPFFWDKTQHGQAEEDVPTDDRDDASEAPTI